MAKHFPFTIYKQMLKPSSFLFLKTTNQNSSTRYGVGFLCSLHFYQAMNPTDSRPVESLKALNAKLTKP